MKTFFDGPFKNSLFEGNAWKNKSAMVIIPHQDDEINLTGATIRNMLDHNIRIMVVFCTNSDRFEPGMLRIREGMASCSALGVPDENVIFLGYCNTFRIHKNLQFYNADSDDIVVTSTRGLTETYGTPENPEFCFLHHHIHHPYTRRNFRSDIKDVILTYHPDIIFANDFDRHPDHRAFSFLIEEALAEILHVQGNQYCPEVYKGFCYNGSFLGKRDFYSSVNLKGEVRAEGSFSNDPTFDTDFPPYDWEKRVRLPVPKGYVSRTLNGSNIYPAIRAHFSQGLLHNAKRIINSDQIFWHRRTDSLTYQAKISVSSGNGAFLTDFKLADCPDVIAEPATLNGGTWIPDAADVKKEALIEFSEPKTVSSIVLYGNADLDNQVLSGTFMLSSGYTQDFGPLRPGAKANTFNFDPQDGITWVRLSLTKLQGTEAGMNEIEMYTDATVPTLIHFIKIMIDKTFAYDYWLTTSTRNCTLQLYTYCSGQATVYDANVSNKYIWKAVNKGDFELHENNLSFGPAFKEAVIAVSEAGSPEIYDQIVIRKKNVLQIAWLKLIQGFDVAHNRIEHIVKHWYYKKFIREKDPNVGKLRD